MARSAGQQNPVVTVVVPSLNPGPARLERCLDSLTAQDYPSLEILVMDGGSDDGSRAIAAERTGVTLVAEPDDGQADAIRRGFERASGDLLGWLGGDDTLAPHAVRRCVEALQQHPDAGWAYGSVVLVEEGSERVLVPPSDLEPADFYWGDPVSQPGALITRSALRAIGGVDPSYRFAMDLDLWVRLVDAGYCGVRVDAVLARFEVHAGSKTGSAPPEDFLLEEARSYRDHGWEEAAALVLGQAVAVADPGSVAGLRRAVEEICSRGDWASLPEDLVLAGAFTRAGIDALRDRRGGLRYLLQPPPWRHWQTRRRLLVAGRRCAATLAGRDPGHIQNR